MLLHAGQCHVSSLPRCAPVCRRDISGRRKEAANEAALRAFGDAADEEARQTCAAGGSGGGLCEEMGQAPSGLLEGAGQSGGQFGAEQANQGSDRGSQQQQTKRERPRAA